MGQAKNKKKDPGLLHIQKLGLRAEKSGDQLLYDVRAKFGSRGIAYMAKISEIAEREGYTCAFYDARSRSADMAMFLSGAYSGDVFRRACNWIDGHKDYFGDTILEVGCELGLVTTFLGQEFPDKKIVAIDRSKNSIKIAKENVKKAGLSNVELRCCDLKDVGEQFDTVFSLRTVPENFLNPSDEYRWKDWRKYSDELVPSVQAYAESTAAALKKDGTLISIEHYGKTPEFPAWMKALVKCGIGIALDAPLEAVRLGEGQSFPVCTGSRNMPLHAASTLENDWARFVGYNPDLTRWTGWAAQIAVQAKAENLVYGFIAREEHHEAKQALYTVKRNKYQNLLLSCVGDSNQWKAYYTPAIQQPKTIADLKESARLLRTLGGAQIELLPGSIV